MESRMEKYQTKPALKARSERNKKLYEEIVNSFLEYNKIDINNAIELSENKEIKTRSEYQRRKEYETFVSNKKEEPKEVEKIEQEPRVHDINEILKLARENKLFDNNDDKKRLINTEYNILTKLDIDKINSKEEYSKDALKDLINSIYSSEEKKNPKKEIETDLFEDLKAKDLEISEDLSLKVLDKVPHEKTELIEIVDEDQANEDEKDNTTEDVIETIKEEKHEQDEENEVEEIDFELEKRSFGTVLVIIFVIVLLLGAGYILYNYFIN